MPVMKHPMKNAVGSSTMPYAGDFMAKMPMMAPETKSQSGSSANEPGLRYSLMASSTMVRILTPNENTNKAVDIT